MSNGPDGFYTYTYTGDFGIGLGVFAIADEGIRGGDWGGLTFAGDVAVDQAEAVLKVSMRLDVPQGLELVMGTSAQDIPHSRMFDFTMPLNFAEADPFSIGVPPGRVWLTVRRAREHLTWLSEPPALKRFSEGIQSLFREGANR